MSRNVDVSLLHQKLRAAVPDIIVEVNASREARRGGFTLHLFEGARPPSRQEALYKRGRDPKADDFGRTVTRARAYQSAHQFGEGMDLVFKKDGVWTWESDAPWSVMESEVRARGLVTLSFERPHVQLSSFTWRERERGPDDDAQWAVWLRRLVS